MYWCLIEQKTFKNNLKNALNSKLIFALRTQKTKQTPPCYIRASDVMFKSHEAKNERHLIYGNTSKLVAEKTEKDSKVISSPVS